MQLNKSDEEAVTTELCRMIAHLWLRVGTWQLMAGLAGQARGYANEARSECLYSYGGTLVLFSSSTHNRKRIVSLIETEDRPIEDCF